MSHVPSSDWGNDARGTFRNILPNITELSFYYAHTICPTCGPTPTHHLPDFRHNSYTPSPRHYAQLLHDICPTYDPTLTRHLPDIRPPSARHMHTMRHNSYTTSVRHLPDFSHTICPTSDPTPTHHLRTMRQYIRQCTRQYSIKKYKIY